MYGVFNSTAFTVGSTLFEKLLTPPQIFRLHLSLIVGDATATLLVMEANLVFQAFNPLELQVPAPPGLDTTAVSSSR